MSSEYVRQTGDGYVGIHRCGSGKATVSLAMADVDWQLREEIVATRAADGIQLQSASAADDERLGEYQVSDQGHGPHVTIGAPALRALGMPDEVRVYQDGDALLLVDADDDPRIMADGGKSTSGSERESWLSLARHYWPILRMVVGVYALIALSFGFLVVMHG